MDAEEKIIIDLLSAKIHALADILNLEFFENPARNYHSSMNPIMCRRKPDFNITIMQKDSTK